MSVDTGYYYKLTNLQHGDDVALESNASGNQPAMVSWGGGHPGQMWRLTPHGDHMQLSSQFSGEGYALEGGAIGGQAWLQDFGPRTGQLWTLREVADSTYRLSSKNMEQDHGDRIALDGGDVGGNAGQREWDESPGQLWKLTRLHAVPQPGPVPSLSGGREAAVSAGLVPTTGKPKAYFIYVDFPDADGKPEDIARLRKVAAQGDQLETAIEAQSYGKLDLQITWGTEWVTMPKNVTEYVPADGSGWNYQQFCKDAVGLVPSGSETYDFVMIGLPSTATGFTIGAGAHYEKVGTVKCEINLSPKTYEEHPTTLMHEIGHVFGLPDLYPMQAPYIHKVGPWDVMGDVVYATGFLGWHRHLFGWLDAKRIATVGPGQRYLGAIAPLDLRHGVAMVLVRPDSGTGPAPELYAVQVAPAVVARDGTTKSEKSAGVLVYRLQADPGEHPGQPMEIVPKDPVDESNSSVSLITAAPFPVGTVVDRDDLPFTLNVAARAIDAYYVDIRPKS